MDKEPLTLQQLADIIRVLPTMGQVVAEVERKLGDSPSRLDSMLPTGSMWASYYELDFVAHLALAAVSLGLAPKIAEIAAAPDPHRALLDRMHEESPEQRHEAFTDPQVMCLAISVGKSVTCLMTHGRSISSLVADVRERADMDALFEVLRIDRAAVACPSIARWIARAELLHDEQFFDRFRKALKGPSKKRMHGHFDQLRYAFAVLREHGVDDLSDAQLEEVFVHDLKIYPNVPSARRNLRAQYQRSRKLATI